MLLWVGYEHAAIFVITDCFFKEIEFMILLQFKFFIVHSTLLVLLLLKIESHSIILNLLVQILLLKDVHVLHETIFFVIALVFLESCHQLHLQSMTELSLVRHIHIHTFDTFWHDQRQTILLQFQADRTVTV